MEFVPVRSFDSYIEANILKGRLEEENIVCHLTNEYSVTINPVLSNAVGGIQLCVASVQVERCLNLLRLFEKQEISCPDCESSSVEQRKQQTQPVNFVEKVLVFLIGSSAIPQRTVHYCATCGKEIDGSYKNHLQNSSWNG